MIVHVDYNDLSTLRDNICNLREGSTDEAFNNDVDALILRIEKKIDQAIAREDRKARKRYPFSTKWSERNDAS